MRVIQNSAAEFWIIIQAPLFVGSPAFLFIGMRPCLSQDGQLIKSRRRCPEILSDPVQCAASGCNHSSRSSAGALLLPVRLAELLSLLNQAGLANPPEQIV